jgi:hypothetical protein
MVPLFRIAEGYFFKADTVSPLRRTPMEMAGDDHGNPITPMPVFSLVSATPDGESRNSG